MNELELAHARRVIHSCIEQFELALHGLTVFTEAASGAYLWTPLLAALAGADHVYAVTADSSYATAAEVVETTLTAAEALGVRDRLDVGTEKRGEWLASSDVVTNSGFVRPISGDTLAALRDTAVIPLMWEPWEFREADLDLAECRRRGILVLGTNEHEPPCDMRPYGGLLGLRLLFELGIEVCRSRIAVLGDQPSLGVPIAAALRGHGAEVDWYGASVEYGARPYDAAVLPAGGWDAVVVAEHHDPRLLIGAGGVFAPEELAAANPAVAVGVISGNVDAGAIAASCAKLLPAEPRPFGLMSYQPDQLGPRPVLELYAAGLKVGEVAARLRLGGASPAVAAEAALRDAPAMDFDGEFAWTSG